MQLPYILIPLPFHRDVVPPRYKVTGSYPEAIVQAGGAPLYVTRPDEERLRKLLPLADGILLVGGHDIDPKRYNEKDTGYTREIDSERDRIELTLVRLALQHRIPLFGICRGMQVINVALGGSLYQDVVAEMAGAQDHDHHKDDATGKDLPRDHQAHDVSVAAHTLLSAIIGKGPIGVNSLHHQGVKTLGKDLIASAIAPDGLVEAIELPGHPFFLGVEWHPEDLTDEPSQKLFAAFIKAAKSPT